jgi:hypothetical protein
LFGCTTDFTSKPYVLRPELFDPIIPAIFDFG